jgi:type IV pilus assembly protein PilV
MRTLSRNTGARGFSLLEVMVAVIVICVGLLGIAKMQSLALSNTTTSRQRALAALQAAGLASAMHSNREYWDNVAGNPYTLTITSGTPANVSAPNDAQLQADLNADIATAPSILACIATAASSTPKCTNNGEQLAAFDLARWWVNGLVPMLPNPSATITCSQPPAGTPGPMACTIQIGWSEKAVAMNAQEVGQANGWFETPTYTLYVEP